MYKVRNNEKQRVPWVLGISRLTRAQTSNDAVGWRFFRGICWVVAGIIQRIFIGMMNRRNGSSRSMEIPESYRLSAPVTWIAGGRRIDRKAPGWCSMALERDDTDLYFFPSLFHTEARLSSVNNGADIFARPGAVFEYTWEHISEQNRNPVEISFCIFKFRSQVRSRIF